MGSMEELMNRGVQSSDGPQSLLSAPEAERMIDQLQAFSIKDVGCPKWHAQHEWLNQLNAQAHYNAQTHSDEFVMELFVSLDRIRVLVHELLVIEVWKAKVLPHLMKHMADHVDTLVWYSVLLHEGVVANLLECVLYHHQALEAMPEDYQLELADWSYRKLLYLNNDAHKFNETRASERTAQQLMNMSKEEEIKEKNAEIEFSTAMASLGILRYLSDHVADLSIGLLGRMISTNDVILALLPLLDAAPWVCRRPKGQLEKYIGNKWVVVPPAERIKLTLNDGQVWLTLHNLLMEPRCRAKYFPVDEFKKERLLGLKRWMNELLIDQLPVLKDLQRMLDELALGVLHGGDQSKNAGLILEQVPVVRDALLKPRDWRLFALEQARTHFGESSRAVAQDRMATMLKTIEYLAGLEGGGGGGAHTEDAAGGVETPGVGPVQVGTWRKAHETKSTGAIWESWTDFVLEVDQAKPPDPVEVADGGHSVHGLRYRLTNLDLEATRALPSNGKISVRTTASSGTSSSNSIIGAPGPAPIRLSADALLQLPEVPTKELLSDSPALIWVTVGLLAIDGVALQLKLKRAEKLKERDKYAGNWYAYHVVGGALTVLRDPITNAPAGAPAGAAKGVEVIPGGGRAKPPPLEGGAGITAVPPKEKKIEKEVNQSVPPQPSQEASQQVGKEAAPVTASASVPPPPKVEEMGSSLHMEALATSLVPESVPDAATNEGGMPDALVPESAPDAATNEGGMPEAAVEKMCMEYSDLDLPD